MDLFMHFQQAAAEEMHDRLRSLLSARDFHEFLDENIRLSAPENGILPDSHLMVATLLAQMVFGEHGPNMYGVSRVDYFKRLHKVNPRIFQLMYLSTPGQAGPIRISIDGVGARDPITFYLPAVCGYTSVIPLTAEGFWAYLSGAISQFEFHGPDPKANSTYSQHIVSGDAAISQSTRIYVQAIFHLNRLAYYFPDPHTSFQVTPSKRPDVDENVTDYMSQIGCRVPGSGVFAHIGHYFPPISTTIGRRDHEVEHTPLVVVEATTWWGMRLMDRWGLLKFGKSKDGNTTWIADFSDDLNRMSKRRRDLQTEILKNVIRKRPPEAK